jgi:hypothetical protein
METQYKTPKQTKLLLSSTIASPDSTISAQALAGIIMLVGQTHCLNILHQLYLWGVHML